MVKFACTLGYRFMIAGFTGVVKHGKVFHWDWLVYPPT
jgi:hypothetical protein